MQMSQNHRTENGWGWMDLWNSFIPTFQSKMASYSQLSRMVFGYFWMPPMTDSTISLGSLCQCLITFLVNSDFSLSDRKWSDLCWIFSLKLIFCTRPDGAGSLSWILTLPWSWHASFHSLSGQKTVLLLYDWNTFMLYSLKCKDNRKKIYCEL